MNIENLLRDFILRNYRSLRSFAVKNNLPPTTITTLLQHSVDKSSFQSVVAICHALHISIEALANGEIVRIDGSGQPLPVLPPHDQALLDAYHAMSSQEQQMVCRMVGIKHPDEKQKRTNSTHEEDTRMNRHDQELLAAYRALDAEQQRLICRTLGISMPEENNPKGK